MEIIQEPRLGENFRLRFPRPGYEANYFLSSQQKVSRIEARPDGVTCHYDSLRNEREEIDVSAAYHIRAVEGRLEFSLEIENSSGFARWPKFSTASSAARTAWSIAQETESLVPGAVFQSLA